MPLNQLQNAMHSAANALPATMTAPLQNAATQGAHFSQPLWLWGLLLLPVIWALYALFYRRGPSAAHLEKFADAHLISHLLAMGQNGDQGGAHHSAQGQRPDNSKKPKQRRAAPRILLWSLLWTLGLIAMAGPRWGYTEAKAFTPARNLVVLLDLSRSMDAQDSKPSRLARARQEIEDILRQSEGINVGLIAYASVPHVIAPLTDDSETISRLLPSLNTGLVYTQGANLAPALARAGVMLDQVPGDRKYILVLSDGGFDDGSAAILRTEQDLRAKGIHIDTMGVGTAEGAPIPNGRGGLIKDQSGRPVISKIGTNALKQVAQDGGGIYLPASYLDSDTNTIMAQIGKAGGQKSEKTTRIWEEHFYLFLLPLVLFLLPLFRRNAAFPALLFLGMLMMAAPNAVAADASTNAQPAASGNVQQAVNSNAASTENSGNIWKNWFLNKDQQGAQAIEQKNYKAAIGKFNDAYRRGVAEYKAGEYQKAAQSFATAKRQDIATDAEYNLGNAQLMGGQIEQAIKSYETVLKNHPNHADAKHNLEIAKKLLQQQKQQQQQQNQKQGQNKDQQQQNQGGQSGQDQKQQDKNNQDKQNQNQGQQGQQNKDQQSKSGQNSEQSQDQQQKQNQSETGQNKEQQDKEKSAQNKNASEQKSGEKKDEQNKQQQSQNSSQAQKQAQDQKNSAEKQQEQNKQNQSASQQKEEQQPQNPQNAQQQQQKAQQAQNGEPQSPQNMTPEQQRAAAQQQQAAAQKSMTDIEADQWLSRMKTDTENFLKNKFYIESQRQGATQGDKPW